MRDMIKERRDAEKKEERDDLFSSLLDASEAEADAQLKLSDSELVGEYGHHRSFMNCMFTLWTGNIYIFLIAGTICLSLDHWK